MDCCMSGFSVFHYLPKFAQIHVHWVGDLTISSSATPFSFCLSLSQHQVFSNESALPISWPKYWSFSFSINPSNEYLGLISFRIDWFDLLAVQGTLKSLLQHHNSKASILQCSAFFGFPGGSVVKNPPAVQETQVWSLGLEDPLEKEMATHFSILAYTPRDCRSWTQLRD